MWRYSSRRAACMPRSGASEETNPVDNLTWDIWLPELWDHKCLAFRPPSLRCLATMPQDDLHSTQQVFTLLVIITQHPRQIRNVSSPPRTAALLSALSQRPFLPRCLAPSSLLTQRPLQLQLPSPMQPLWSHLPPSTVHSLDSGQLAWIQALQPVKHKLVSAIHSGTQTSLLSRPSHLDLWQESL